MLGTVTRTTPAIAFTVPGDQVEHRFRATRRYGPGQEVIGAQLRVGRDAEHGRQIDVWAKRIAMEAAKAYTGAPLTGPLAMELRLMRPRPASHYGSGRNSGQLRASAPRYPTTGFGVIDYAQVVDFALRDVVFVNSAQIVEKNLLKVFGDPPRLEVEIYVLDANSQPLEAPAGQTSLEELAA